MRVNDAIKLLETIRDNGKGEFPLQFMAFDGGITYADDIEITDAQDYDGDRVWIYATKRHNPEWMK